MGLTSILAFLRADSSHPKPSTKPPKDMTKFRKDIETTQQLKIVNFDKLKKLKYPVQGRSGPTLVVAPCNLDGEWGCCGCDQINALVKIEGPHPLGYTVCSNTKCSHVWCRDCDHTDVAQFVPQKARKHILSKLCRDLPEDAELPEGTVCEQCGLTWRAHEADSHYVCFPRLKCYCGAKFPTTSLMVFTMPWDDVSNGVIKRGIEKWLAGEYSAAHDQFQAGIQKMNEIGRLRSRHVLPVGIPEALEESIELRPLEFV